MLLATFEIPGRCRIKKNGKRIFSQARRSGPGRITVLNSKQFTEWENKAIWCLRKQWGRTSPIDFPIEAHFEFHFENRQAEPDTSNCVEGPQDAMQSAGIITNDKIIKRLVAEKFFGGEAKTVIKLYSIEEVPSVAVG